MTRPAAMNDPAFRLHCADARDLSSLFSDLSLPSKPFIATTITSPPYGTLKDYGGKSQVGWRQVHEEYLADCGKVLEQVHAATLGNGSLWLIADTVTIRQAGIGFALQMLPFQLAEIAADAGWTLRDVIIWHKDRTVPWAAPGRLRNAFEYVLFFVKSSEFKYYPKRLAEPVEASNWWIRFPERYSPDGITPSNVWTIPIPKQGAWGQESARHPCPFPSELVDRLVKLSTDPGDVVFDPFAGTGIVLARAAALRRKAIGMETNEELVSSFEFPPQGPPATSQASDPARTTIWKLRALKYPRVIAERATTPALSAHPIQFVIVEAKVRARAAQRVTGTVTFVVEGRPSASRRAAIETALVQAATRKPASKFGLDLTITVATRDEIEGAPTRLLWRYPNGRFWAYEERVTVSDQLSRDPTKRVTVVSNIKVNENREAAEIRD